jgi:hypothetical protein
LLRLNNAPNWSIAAFLYCIVPPRFSDAIRDPYPTSII